MTMHTNTTNHIKSDEGKLIIVSNRLPVTLSRKKDGYWTFTPSSGGLVSALSDLKREMKFIWVGWPGFEIPENEHEMISKRLYDEFSCVPVYLPKEMAEKFYDGFSNSVIWPLFHYHSSGMPFEPDLYEGYKKANSEFAEMVLKLVEANDIIWVHDYQLILLSQMLRQRLKIKSVSIAFFLHIPFPSSEMFRTQPAKEELLDGLLGCDMIGFHTYDYSRHFLSSCHHIFSLRTGFSTVELPQRLVHVRIFPIGIDPHKFTDTLALPDVKQRAAELRDKFKDVRIIVGVDRLDYIKGLPHKLRAFENFLETNPEWVGKIVLIQVAVPSRQNVEEYKLLRKVINEMVGRINGKFARIDYCPIYFVYNNLNFNEMVALYSVADICLVSSTRDGMNLVSYEFIACQAEKKGTLILSEFTGAAQSFNGALIVNPWDAIDVARAILEAVTMSEETKIKNYMLLCKYVNKFTAVRWGLEFIKELKSIRDNYNDSKNIITTEEVCRRVKAASGKRFVFLACDSAISPYTLSDNSNINTSDLFIKAVTELAKRKVFVYVMSADRKSKLEELFPNKSIGLCAELGCFYRHPDFADIVMSSLEKDIYNFSPFLKESVILKTDSNTNAGGSHPKQYKADCFSNGDWISLVSETEFSWKKRVVPIFGLYARSMPQSKFEEKDVNFFWYSTAKDPMHRSWQASELKELISNATMNTFLTTSIENDALVLKPTTIDRSMAITSIMQDHYKLNSDKVLQRSPLNNLYNPNGECSLSPCSMGKSMGKHLDTTVSVAENDICILVSDSRYEDERFRSLFGKVSTQSKSTLTGYNTIHPQNTIMFLVGGNKHVGAQYHLDGIQSLISLLNSIAASLSQPS